MKNTIVLLAAFLFLQPFCFAGMKLCFTINGQLHCIDIPVEYNPQWPWEIRHVGSIKPEVLKDFAVLNVMDLLAGELSVELGDGVRPIIQDLGSSIELPEGFALSIRSQKTDGSPLWTYDLGERGQVQIPVQMAYGLDVGPAKVGICEPVPQPWLVHPELDRTTLQNLALIATISELSSDLSPGVGDEIQSVLGSVVDSMNLPKNVEVQFK